MYGPYYESLAAVPNRELSTYLPGRDAAKDAEPIPTKTAKHEGFLWDKKDASFEDVLDTINPLHHIPIISTLYHESSGDTIGAVPRVLGGALYGLGPIGAVLGAASALVNVAVEAVTGKDIGGTMMALLTGDESDGTALAEDKSGTSSTGGAAAAAPAADNAKAADTSPLPSPAEELRSFPGVNLRPAKAAAGTTELHHKHPGGTTPDVGRTAPDKHAAASAPAAPNFGGALGGAAPTGTAPQKSTPTGEPGNAWVSQSILSGLDKYRSMSRDPDKKPATVDGIY